jgi:hypothetical protein
MPEVGFTHVGLKGLRHLVPQTARPLCSARGMFKKKTKNKLHGLSP